VAADRAGALAVAARPRGALSAPAAPRRDELPLGRLDAFSDGVFAIAITLLVLELGVEEGAGDHLLRSILDEWESYLAYVTSFLTIGVVWLQHSAITATLRAADSTLYRINLLVLLLASFLPFPTKLVSEFVGDRDPERVAVVFYGLTLLLLTLALTVFVRYAAEHRRLVRDEVGAEAVEDALVHQPSFLLYALGIGVGLLLPTVGVALFLATALYLGIPGRTLHRLLRGR
jgi:uncharacterized membrane protein